MNNFSYKQLFEKALRKYLPNNKSQIYAGDWGLSRTKELLKYFDNPQNKLKVIHVAGTSGKGSTCYFISQILQSQGLRVGLHVSPWVISVAEEFQINGKSLSFQKLFKYFLDFEKGIEFLKSKNLQPTHFEIVKSFAYFVFYKEKVDYAVVETAMGGRFDCTNTVDNQSKIAVLTRIGFDHQEILGDTLEKIAWQKAGIIQTKNHVFSYPAEPEIMKIFSQESKFKDATLNISKNNFKINKADENGIYFDFKSKDLSLTNLYLPLIGDFQAENFNLALEASIEVFKREKITIQKTKIQDFLQRIYIPGRLQLVANLLNDKKVIFDGAHNPQKIEATVSTLKNIFKNRKVLIICGFSTGRDISLMIDELYKLSSDIYFCLFKIPGLSTNIKRSISKNEYQNLLGNKAKIFKNVNECLNNLNSISKDFEVVLFTGSMYFISEILLETKKSTKKV